jgi:hypothetical protein
MTFASVADASGGSFLVKMIFSIDESPLRSTSYWTVALYLAGAQARFAFICLSIVNTTGNRAATNFGLVGHDPLQGPFAVSPTVVSHWSILCGLLLRLTLPLMTTSTVSAPGASSLDRLLSNRRESKKVTWAGALS